MKYQDETIAAIITPIGEGGVSIVRVSGMKAIEISDIGFRGKNRLAEVASHTIHFGRFKDKENKEVDEVLVSVFKNPSSYTGEDVVEISCHGSILVTQMLLDAILSYGARLAEPGEFTKRAFLNGKMDLLQAEAVADLIQSKSEAYRKSSVNQLDGILSAKINNISSKLLNLCSLIELDLDFVEEGLDVINHEGIKSEVNTAIKEIENILSTYKYGKFYRDGIKVVLCGKPNVGKSSLLNALLGHDRAIVTDISGTTRDTLEESILINGLRFRVVDTAGIRKTEDIIESEGIRRTQKEIESSDVIIYLLEATKIDFQESSAWLSEVSEFIDCGKLIVGINKVDLVNGVDIETGLNTITKFPIVLLSATQVTGLDKLKIELANVVSRETGFSESNIVITNQRHFELLGKTADSLRNAICGLEEKVSGEFLAVDIRSALNVLSELTGAVTTDDVLNNIFSRFCIGK